MKKHVWIHFACNDGDDGSFAGKVMMASYGESELEYPFSSEATFTAGDNFIRLHRRTFKTIGRSYWVGNWCWDAFKLPRSEAKRLIATMRQHGWRCTHGRTHIFEWWNREGRFSENEAA